MLGGSTKAIEAAKAAAKAALHSTLNGCLDPLDADAQRSAIAAQVRCVRRERGREGGCMGREGGREGGRVHG